MKNPISPWTAIVVVVILVVVLSAFSATKKFAYWIGAIVALIFGLQIAKGNGIL